MTPSCQQLEPPGVPERFEHEMRPQERFAMSSASRGRVQLGRSATGLDSPSSAIARARAALTGAGPGATERRNSTLAESAAPEPHGILAHSEGPGDRRARPAGQGQRERPRPIRLAPIPRVAEGHEVTPLRGARDNRGFARHDPHPDPTHEIVGHPAETCLGRKQEVSGRTRVLEQGVDRAGSVRRQSPHRWSEANQ
jgi:hypothetical protein